MLILESGGNLNEKTQDDRKRSGTGRRVPLHDKNGG